MKPWQKLVKWLNDFISIRTSKIAFFWPLFCLLIGLFWFRYKEKLEETSGFQASVTDIPPKDHFITLNPLTLSWTNFTSTYNIQAIVPCGRQARTTNTQWSLFLSKHQFLVLARQFRQINLGAFVVISVNLSAPILVMWVPCPCFPLFNHDFYKTLSLWLSLRLQPRPASSS